MENVASEQADVLFTALDATPVSSAGFTFSAAVNAASRNSFMGISGSVGQAQLCIWRGSHSSPSQNPDFFQPSPTRSISSASSRGLNSEAANCPS